MLLFFWQQPISYSLIVKIPADELVNTINHCRIIAHPHRHTVIDPIDGFHLNTNSALDDQWHADCCFYGKSFIPV